MPRQFCPKENALYDDSEFSDDGGTAVHNRDPLHRATDGVLLKKENGNPIPAVFSVEWAEEALKENREP